MSEGQAAKQDLEAMGRKRIRIAYKYKEPEKSVVKTNMSIEELKVVFNDYLRKYPKIRSGAAAEKKEEYEISIMPISPRQFDTVSDTGDDGLTFSLLIHIFSMLPRLKIEPL